MKPPNSSKMKTKQRQAQAAIRRLRWMDNINGNIDSLDSDETTEFFSNENETKAGPGCDPETTMDRKYKWEHRFIRLALRGAMDWTF